MQMNEGTVYWFISITGMLHSMGLQRVEHYRETEQQKQLEGIVLEN